MSIYSDLKRLALAQTRRSIDSKYAKQMSEEELLETGLGLLVARFLDFDVGAILRVAYFMFEDANMHVENRTIKKWLKDMGEWE